MIAALVLVSGGWIGDFATSPVAVLHLFSTFCFAVAATALIDRRLVVIAIGYLAGFFAAAARPERFLPISLASHGVMAVTLYFTLGDIRRRLPTPKAPTSGAGAGA